MFKEIIIKHKSFESVIVASILLIIASLPLSTKINGLGIILFCFVTILYAYFKKVPIRVNYIWLFCLPFLFDMIGLLYSSNLQHGVDFTIRRLTILLFPIMFSIVKIDKKLLKDFCYAFILLCTFLGFVCLFWAFYQQIKWSIRWDAWRINWFFFSYHDFVRIISIHSIYFSVYVSFCIIFLSVELFKEQNFSRLSKRSIIFLLAVNFLVLLLLSGRLPITVTLIFFFGMLNYFLWKKNKLLTIAVNFLFIILLIITFSQLTILRERFFGVFGFQNNTEYIQKWDSSKGNVSIRLQKWHGAILVIKDNFFLGTGTGDLDPVLMQKYRDIGFDLGVAQKYNPHNQFLDTTSKTGVLSGMIFILVILIPMINSFKKKEFLYFGFLILVFGVCLTESFLNSQKGIVFYSFFNSLIYSSTYNQNGYNKLKP